MQQSNAHISMANWAVLSQCELADQPRKLILYKGKEQQGLSQDF